MSFSKTQAGSSHNTTTFAKRAASTVPFTIFAITVSKDMEEISIMRVAFLVLLDASIAK